MKAEIGGKVDRMLVKPGNFVTGGEGSAATQLTWITSTDPIYCMIDANEASILKYQRLARANSASAPAKRRSPPSSRSPTNRSSSRQGYIDFVSNRMNPNTGTMLSRAVFDNKDGFMKDGMFARVRVPGSGAYKAVLIPGEAIGSDQSQKFVFVVDDQGVAHPRPVKLGSRFRRLSRREQRADHAGPGDRERADEGPPRCKGKRAGRAVA